MKKRSNRRRKQANSKLHFETLEPRQLLAGDLLGPHQVAGNLPTGTNILANGDFETTSTSTDNFYLASEVDNWSTRDNATLNIFDYAGGYDHVLDLDSTPAAFDRVFQNVDVQANQDYLITFDFRAHTATPDGASSITNDFEVWWGGSLVAIYTGMDYWQTGTVRVNAGSNTTSELLFCEVLEQARPGGDGLGPLLDNIRVFQATDYELSNAGFENTSSGGIFNRPYHVDGWGAAGVDVNDRWLKIVPSGDNATATEGQQYLNLDATESTRDIIFRELDTTAGASYYITFDMRVDGDTSVDDDEMRVRWNDAWAATLHGDSDWQNYGIMVTADSDTTMLSFLEPGVGDGSGPLIDNVQIFNVLQNDINLDANGIEAGTTGAATFFPGAGSQNIGSEISLTHPSNDRITSATITLNGVVDGNNELIAVAEGLIPVENGTPKIIINSYRPETRQMQLVGEATAEEYQTVLRSLSYLNARDNVSTSARSVSIQVANNNLPATDSTASAAINISVETDQAAIDDVILQKFIADNNLNAVPVQEGLYAVIDQPGSGINPTINSTVRVAYDGKFLTLNNQNQLVEGDSFDASSSEGITFPLQNVIRGWQLGIPEFQTNGSGKLLIPSHLAYGPNGNGSIPPNEVLIFDVELLEII
ncbi:MAG: FKBP-type peptidyl-prolyl cis-trans isomerase [Planctomycetota bacterium]